MVGATSGIGKELAILLADHDYRVGITGRRHDLLAELASDRPASFMTQSFDVTALQNEDELEALTTQLDGLDLLIISSGVGEVNHSLDFAIEKPTIEVNVLAFTQIADWAFTHFLRQGSGHLVVISSIAGLRGSRYAPAYNASKAYQINYLAGLRQKAAHLHLPITITDIRPGFVKTDMAKGEGLFWVASAQKAANQIYTAIQKKRRVAYITKRWWLIASLLRIVPESIYYSDY